MSRQDHEVPDASCKTMPHREGKCGVRLEAALGRAAAAIVPAKRCLLGERPTPVSFSSTRCDQAGVCQFGSWWGEGRPQMVGTRKWGGRGSLWKAPCSSSSASASCFSSSSVFPLLSCLQLRRRRGKECLRGVTCRLKSGLIKGAGWCPERRGDGGKTKGPADPQTEGRRARNKRAPVAGTKQDPDDATGGCGLEKAEASPSRTWLRLHQFPAGSA